MSYHRLGDKPLKSTGLADTDGNLLIRATDRNGQEHDYVFELEWDTLISIAARNVISRKAFLKHQEFIKNG